MTHHISNSGKNIRYSSLQQTWPRVFVAIVLVAITLAAVIPWFSHTRASAPSSGTIDVTTTAPVTWIGTGTGGGALNAPLGLIAPEDMCQEGINCDTFTLNVSGTPADWSGKLIHVKIEW